MPLQRGLSSAMSVLCRGWGCNLWSHQRRNTPVLPNHCVTPWAHQGTSRATLHPSVVPHLYHVAMNTNSYKQHGLKQHYMRKAPVWGAQQTGLPTAKQHTRSQVFPVFTPTASLKVTLKTIKPGKLFLNMEPSLNQVNSFSLQHKQRLQDHTNCN